MSERNLLVDRFSSAGLQVILDVQVVGEDVAEAVAPLELGALVHVSVGTHLQV